MTHDIVPSYLFWSGVQWVRYDALGPYEGLGGFGENLSGLILRDLDSEVNGVHVR